MILWRLGFGNAFEVWRELVNEYLDAVGYTGSKNRLASGKIVQDKTDDIKECGS